MPKSPARAIALVPRVSIEGIVFDSVYKRPLEGAQVYLSGTSFRTTSGEAGRFLLDSIPAGAYYVAFSHPRLDSLPEYPLPVPVQATSDVHNINISTPSVESLLGRLCPADQWERVQKLSGDTLSENRGFFYGTMNTPNGPMQGATVEAKWARIVDRGGRLDDRMTYLSVRNSSLVVTTDDQGGFSICRLPLDREIEVHVRQRDVTLARDTIDIPSTGLYRRDYLIRRAQASQDVRLRFIGRVVDADTRDPRQWRLPCTLHWQQEIERRTPTMLTDLLNDIPGVQIYNIGVGRRVVRLNRTGPGGLQRRSRFPGCEPALFIDGRRHLDRNSTADPAVDDFNVLAPIAIEAIEIYTGNTPVEFKSDCGAIVIWTQRGR